MNETNGHDWKRNRWFMWTAFACVLLTIGGTTVWATGAVRGWLDAPEADQNEEAAWQEEAPEADVVLETVEIEFLPLDTLRDDHEATPNTGEAGSESAPADKKAKADSRSDH